MGSVWLAERNDGRFKRRVAVKLLRSPLLGRAGGERFKREGTILAGLVHPHIAQLLDAGVSPAGQPYLTLESVEGHNIAAYCDGRTLDVEARLRLFLDVLAAVAHAHAHLVVHRDIKPSNVSVGNDGQVKLLDFGITKLIEEEGPEGAATQLTREGGGALTPHFAALEQITGGAVTTATDVYALGVLLTGQRPDTITYRAGKFIWRNRIGVADLRGDCCRLGGRTISGKRGATALPGRAQPRPHLCFRSA
jgi:serine/threonine-protein kinase